MCLASVVAPSKQPPLNQIRATHNINYWWLWVHIKDQWWNVPFPTDGVTLIIYSSLLICKLCLIKAALWIECGNILLLSAQITKWDIPFPLIETLKIHQITSFYQTFLVYRKWLIENWGQILSCFLNPTRGSLRPEEVGLARLRSLTLNFLLLHFVSRITEQPGLSFHEGFQSS